MFAHVAEGPSAGSDLRRGHLADVGRRARDQAAKTRMRFLVRVDLLVGVDERLRVGVEVAEPLAEAVVGQREGDATDDVRVVRLDLQTKTERESVNETGAFTWLAYLAHRQADGHEHMSSW